jgi:hypothetical protein
MNKGAKPSNTVARLLEKEKIKHRSVVVVKKKKQPKTAKIEETKPASMDVAPTTNDSPKAEAPTPIAREEDADNETTTENAETPATAEPVA